MTWTLSASLDEFRTEAGAFLAADPARNTVLLTLVDQLGRGGLHIYGEQPPLFGWRRSAPDGPVDSAYMQTPPFAVRLGVMPVAAAAELARELHARKVEVPGVGGAKDAALAFAAAWRELTGTEATVHADERLYRLGELVPPAVPPAGAVRLAGPADRELLIEWTVAFMREADVVLPDDIGALVDRRIADRCWHLWEDAGRPVAFAGVSPAVAGMSRVGPVYTDPALRGRGYASGITAAVSAQALEAGAEIVLLYTDLANPVSNSIYQRLGYRPVEDSTVLDIG